MDEYIWIMYFLFDQNLKIPHELLYYIYTSKNVLLIDDLLEVDKKTVEI